MKRKISEKYYLKTIVPIAGIIILISSILIGFTSFGTSNNSIEKYDDVKIEYTVWESSGAENYEEETPIFDSDIWVAMIPITENDTNGLILGLYNNLLGKELYYESGLIWLDKCIDQDRDGIDDITGEIALTYGNSSDLYFNTDLVIEFKVLEIQKNSDVPEISFDWARFSEFFQFLFLFVLLPLLGILLTILLIFIINYFIRNPDRINGHKLKIGFLNIGIIVVVCFAIVYSTLWIIDLTITPEEFNLLKTQYSFFINSIITLNVLLCLSFIISYLLVWNLKKKSKS